MALSDLSGFFSLSRTINYSLSDTVSGRYYVLNYITDRQPFPSQKDKGVVMSALAYLLTLYTDKYRELGPPAVLHPLRAAALLSRASHKLDVTELLTVLFHDVLEDILPPDMNEELYSLIKKEKDREILKRNLKALTRTDTETYNDYIGRLLSETPEALDLVKIKLADRLDNTLDLRIDLEESWGSEYFFESIFKLLFVQEANVTNPPDTPHPPTAPLNGAQRLYQLFKNTMLLSLIRQKIADQLDETAQTLFQAISNASLKEVQRIFMHIMVHHPSHFDDLRETLMQAMAYCHSGKTDRITVPGNVEPLDGLFSSYFDHKTTAERRKKLNRLYKDKPLMVQASIAFTVIFLNFLNDPTFFVKGISPDGIHPE